MLARTPLPYSEFLDDMRICAGITRRHAKSFSAGIRLFPLERRWATWALYGFVRLPDDIVDVEYANDIEGGRKALQEWITEWKFVLAGGETNDPVFRATRWLLKEYPEIKLEWLDTFLDKMLQDTDTDRYQKYSDLEEYMYGSATVVGYAMAVICGAKGDWMPGAKALAEAFQMTNFLRDIDADYQERGRVYLPQEDMQHFGVSEQALIKKMNDSAWSSLMRFEITRTRKLYVVARKAIAQLSPDCQLGVSIAADIYEAILDKIEAADHNVFEKRLKTSTPHKLALAVRRTGIHLKERYV